MKITILILSLLGLLNPLDGQEYNNNPNIFVYNNDRDTIFLKPQNFDGLSTSKLTVYDSLQIDGKGLKEIVLSRSFRGEINQHGGTYDIDELLCYHKYEIWNLDTKSLLFEFTNYYFHHYNRFIIPNHSKGSRIDHYDFEIDKMGQITISKILSSIDVEVSNFSTDHHQSEVKEGIFYFNGNRYVRKE